MSRYLPPLNALKAFEAAAQCQNFTLAAQRLHVTQSAISRQVRHLEEQLGVSLFERRPGQLRLTEAGRRLLPALSTSFDRIALTVLTLAEQRGLRIPDDLRITGFDGIAEGQYRAPRLTTVRQDSTEKGRLAARMILDVEPAVSRLMTTELVIGDTCP